MQKKGKKIKIPAFHPASIISINLSPSLKRKKQKQFPLCSIYHTFSTITSLRFYHLILISKYVLMIWLKHVLSRWATPFCWHGLQPSLSAVHWQCQYDAIRLICRSTEQLIIGSSLLPWIPAGCWPHGALPLHQTVDLWLAPAEQLILGYHLGMDACRFSLWTPTPITSVVAPFPTQVWQTPGIRNLTISFSFFRELAPHKYYLPIIGDNFIITSYICQEFPLK